MSHPNIDHRADDLLHYATGEQLLMLVSTSNSSMQCQVRRELNRRAVLRGANELPKRTRERSLNRAA